jgi:hypothetical protein
LRERDRNQAAFPIKETDRHSTEHGGLMAAVKF